MLVGNHTSYLTRSARCFVQIFMWRSKPHLDGNLGGRDAGKGKQCVKGGGVLKFTEEF